MNFDVVIPARKASSRFPGKPLIQVNGIPLILRVLSRADAYFPKDKIFVATDSKDIFEVVDSSGYNALMTPVECRTGTDRVAEAAKLLGSEAVINIQGDEPMVLPEHFEVIVKAAEENPNVTHNCYTRIQSEKDLLSLNTPKVVMSDSGLLMYASRLPIPGYKGVKRTKLGFKQVCIYYFPSHHLRHFGVNADKSHLEAAEDIEILRLLERSEPVSMHFLEGNFQAIDVPEDVAEVERLLDAEN